MKAEGEMGYEPSLLVEMEKVRNEAQKQGGQGNDDVDDDVRVEPTRKVTYWHSSCYDDKSCVFDSSFLFDGSIFLYLNLCI